MDKFVPSALHATTTVVDDWLHRGPFLDALPLFVYMQHVQRVPKSQRVFTAGGMYFEFDAHYAMSALYQHTMLRFMMVPRLVGPNCPEYDTADGEGYARWHAALFARARCTGAGRCGDPLLYRHLLTKGDSSRRGHAREQH